MVGAMVWMVGALVWMLGAMLWMVGAMMWMVGATVWMVGATMWMGAHLILACSLAQTAQAARDELLAHNGTAGTGTSNATAVPAVAARDPLKQARLTASVNAIMSSLSAAGVGGSVPGEDPFVVSSENLQMQASVATDPSGTYATPPAPGQNASASPSFGVPEGLAGAPGEEVDVVSSVNNKNPYGFVNSSSNIQVSRRGPFS
eukprot:1195143-Prorocentrum_minimum.AAC.1